MPATTFLQERYAGLTNDIADLMVNPYYFLSAAVYTEVSDAEAEINGWVTYDRQVGLRAMHLSGVWRVPSPPPTPPRCESFGLCRPSCGAGLRAGRSIGMAIYGKSGVGVEGSLLCAQGSTAPGNLAQGSSACMGMLDKVRMMGGGGYNFKKRAYSWGRGSKDWDMLKRSCCHYQRDSAMQKYKHSQVPSSWPSWPFVRECQICQLGTDRGESYRSMTLGLLEHSIGESCTMQVKKVDPKVLFQANQELITKSKALGRSSGKVPPKPAHGNLVRVTTVTERPPDRPSTARSMRPGVVS